MLSYRHAYHAGNHADVLKHSLLCLVLAKLTVKDSPCVYIDTHAGAGLYQLNSAQAQKTGEAAGGIERLLAAPTSIPGLAPYLKTVHQLRGKRPQSYPGSPAIAQQLLRPQDKLNLLELHNKEIDTLRANLGRDRRLSIHHRDGFEGLPALLPPPCPRGLVLMDPAYEVVADYAQAVASLAKAQARWQTGTYMLWYPLLARQRDRSGWLKHELHRQRPRNLLIAELWVQPASEEYGMHGSGVAIVNAPWQLDEQLSALLPALSELLTQAPGAGWKLDWLQAQT